MRGLDSETWIFRTADGHSKDEVSCYVGLVRRGSRKWSSCKLRVAGWRGRGRGRGVAWQNHADRDFCLSSQTRELAGNAMIMIQDMFIPVERSCKFVGGKVKVAEGEGKGKGKLLLMRFGRGQLKSAAVVWVAAGSQSSFSAILEGAIRG